jgi:hypothetical protein
MKTLIRCVALASCLIVHTTATFAQSAVASPLDIRVTIDYRNRPALEVLGVLAASAGLNLDPRPGSLLPVTTTLTNVRLATALAAVCENASCTWQLRDQVLTIIPVAASSTTLPRSISLTLTNASVRDVFFALAGALDLELDIAGELPENAVTITLRKVPPEEALNMLAQIARCSWEFEPGRLKIRRLPRG